MRMPFIFGVLLPVGADWLALSTSTGNFPTATDGFKSVSIATDRHFRPVVAYRDASELVNVIVYSGSDWAYVGNPAWGPTGEYGGPQDITLKVSSSGVQDIFYVGMLSGNAAPASVWSLDIITSTWQKLSLGDLPGPPGVLPAPALSLGISLTGDGYPLAVYSTARSDYDVCCVGVSAVVWDGTDWGSFIGGEHAVWTGIVRGISTATDAATGTTYVAFRQQNFLNSDDALDGFLLVRAYVTSSWVTVGGAANSGAAAAINSMGVRCN